MKKKPELHKLLANFVEMFSETLKNMFEAMLLPVFICNAC